MVTRVRARLGIEFEATGGDVVRARLRLGTWVDMIDSGRARVRLIGFAADDGDGGVYGTRANRARLGCGFGRFGAGGEAARALGTGSFEAAGGDGRGRARFGTGLLEAAADSDGRARARLGRMVTMAMMMAQWRRRC